MKKIGLIGGMSWESSLEYYRIINETVRDRLGGFHSANCLMASIDFADIEAMQQANRWEEASNYLTNVGKSLEKGGAECLLLCTNTMHKVSEAIRAGVQIPFLHIADVTGEKICSYGIETVALLGTRFTMEEDFYVNRLVDGYHLRVLIPELEERQEIHRIIYQELCMGIVLDESKQYYRQVISNLVQKGAQGIILGCTEIGILVKSEDCPVQIFDTTIIHAQSAVDWALACE